MSVVTRAYELHLERTKTALPAKSDWQRHLLEAPFIVMGLAVSKTLSLLPPEWVKEFHNKLFDALASPHRYPFDGEAPELESARALAARLEEKTGRPPAILALISHPPVLGDLAHLNFSLVRHAMLAMRAARGKPCRPRLLVATDFFALDTIPVYQEGLYAGFMGDYHLGFDRIALSRKPLSRLLLRKTSWQRAPSRMLRMLAAGREVGLVLAGGVPGTTRILYAVREWLGRQRRSSPMRGRPGEVLALLRVDPEFERFSRLAPLGPRLRSSAWRMTEAWAMSTMAGVFTGDNGAAEGAVETGILTAAARRCLSRCLGAFGLNAKDQERALAELDAELKRETPYRARFFRILAARVLEAGRPVVFIPVAHSVKPQLGVSVRAAWAWESGDRTSVRGYLPGEKEWQGSPEDFAAAFGKENFA